MASRDATQPVIITPDPRSAQIPYRHSPCALPRAPSEHNQPTVRKGGVGGGMGIGHSARSFRAPQFGAEPPCRPKWKRLCSNSAADICFSVTARVEGYPLPELAASPPLTWPLSG